MLQMQTLSVIVEVSIKSWPQDLRVFISKKNFSTCFEFECSKSKFSIIFEE